MTLGFDVLATVRDGTGATVFANITMDSSYPTNGEAIVADDFGLWGLSSLIPGGVDDAKYHAAWYHDLGKLKMFIEDGTTGIEAEVGNGTNIATVVVPVIVRGTVG